MGATRYLNVFIYPNGKASDDVVSNMAVDEIGLCVDILRDKDPTARGPLRVVADVRCKGVRSFLKTVAYPSLPA